MHRIRLLLQCAKKLHTYHVYIFYYKKCGIFWKRVARMYWLNVHSPCGVCWLSRQNALSHAHHIHARTYAHSHSFSARQGLTPRNGLKLLLDRLFFCICYTLGWTILLYIGLLIWINSLSSPSQTFHTRHNGIAIKYF